MLTEIDRLQNLIDSENVNQDLITTAEGVCKNVVSQMVDGLSDKEEIQQILYVLQNIGRNVSDFNDLIISKDFQQMIQKAVLYLKLGCETEKDEDMFMLMEQFLDAVNILSESSAEGKSTFVENWVEIYLDILLQDKSDFRHILEVLKSLNILLEDASSNVKEYLLSRNSVVDYLSRLAAFLNQVGDYEFQVGIAECLFRIIPKKIREPVSSSIFQNQCTRKSFLQIRDNEFETDCRLFLNSLNASLKRSKRVFSLPCNKAWLGDKELYKPDDPNYDTFWIDFNAGSERLTVFCGPYNSASSQVSNEDLWETLTVWKDDVHSCNVKKIKKIKVVNILFSKTVSDIYPSQQDVSGRSVRLHFDINCCVEDALNMTFGTEMTGPKVSTVSTPLVHKKGEVQQEEDSETLPCTPVSSLCRRKASVPEMHMLGMLSPALSISSKVSEPISAVRINFSKMTSDSVPKDTPKAFQTPKVPAMKSKTKVKTPVVTVTPPSKSKKKTPTKTSSTKLNNDTSNVIITSISKTKKLIDVDSFENKTSLADPLVQSDNIDVDSIPDSCPDVIYLEDSNKVDSGTTRKKSRVKDKDTIQIVDSNPLLLSSNKTKKGTSKNKEANEEAVKFGNTKTTDSKPKKSSGPDMATNVTDEQSTEAIPSYHSVDNPAQMKTRGAKNEKTEKPSRETVDTCGNIHSYLVTMPKSAKDKNNTSVDKDEFQVLDYFPKPKKTLSMNRKRNVKTENEDGLLENQYNGKQQEIANNKQEQIKKKDVVDDKVKNTSAFEFSVDGESFKEEKTEKKKQLKKQMQEKIKFPTVQLQEDVYEQNEVLKTTSKDENYVEKEYAEETLVMGKSTKDRRCKVSNKTELKYFLKKNEKFEQTTATGKGRKVKKNDNTKSIKRSTDSDNTGDESNIKSNKYYDYDELQPLVMEEKTQPSCDEKSLTLSSNNKMVPHKNKEGNKRNNFDKCATCEVELNIVDCELNGVEENKKQADTCYNFSGKKKPHVIQIEDNANYEDINITIPCSLTIEDGETNIGTETNKCLVQGKCVENEKCSKQRKRSKYKNENKHENKKLNKLEEWNVAEVMDQFSTENNACFNLVDKQTSSEQKKISDKIPQELSHTNKIMAKEMVETHDNDQVVLMLACEEKQSNQTKTTKEDLMTKKTKKYQKLDPIVIDEDDYIFKQISDFDSEDYCHVTMDDNHTTKPRSWYKSGRNRKASDEKHFHANETSQSEEKSFQGNKKKIHQSKITKRIENNKNVYDFTVHELCSQDDDLEKREEADMATTNIVKEMPAFSKCGDNTAVNLEDAIVDSIIQSTFDNSQGIEKSPPFTETRGVGMSKIGKYSLRKRNKEKLREAYKTSEDTDDEVTSINSSNEKLVNERLHLSPDNFIQRSKLDKSKAYEQLYGRKQKDSNEGKENSCTVMQNKKFFQSYTSSKLNSDKSENVKSRTFKKMDSSTCFGFNSPRDKVQISRSSKKSVLLFMSYSQSGTILPYEKGDATYDPYDFDAECNINNTTSHTNNQSKEKRSCFTAKDDFYKSNKCKDKDDASMTVQRKNKTYANNYFDSQSPDNVPVFNYGNDIGKKKKQRTSNITQKYLAKSQNFTEGNCHAKQNYVDSFKKTIQVGSKTCVQRENSSQKAKSRTTYNKQKKKHEETKQKEQDNYILKLDDFSCIESPDQNIVADCSGINTEKKSKHKSTSAEQNRNSTVIYQDDERDDDHSLDSQSPVQPLKKLQNKKNKKKRKNKVIYSDEDFNHIEDKTECAPKPTNSILDNFSSICKKIVSNYEDDEVHNSQEDNLPVRITKKLKMLSTPNLPITSSMKTPTTPGTVKRLYKSLDISFIKTPKTPASVYSDDNNVDFTDRFSQKSLLMNNESDADNDEVEEQPLKKDGKQRSMDLKDKKIKRRHDTIEDEHVDDVICSPCSTINKILSRNLASFVDLEEDKLMSPVNIDENPECGPLDKISFTDDTVKNFTRQEKLHHSGFVSGLSTTVRPSKSALKRKYSNVIDSEEEDIDLNIADIPDKFYRPRKLFKEQRYFVEEHSFTNETVSDGSSVAFSDIAATTEVSTLLKAFGLDVQRHIKEKSQNLDSLTKAALKSSQKKIDTVWMIQQQKRSGVLEKYQGNMLRELLALEKDMSLLEKAEDNAMTFFKQQMSYLQKFRMTQDKRLSNLNNLQQGLQEEMSEIENQSSNQHAVLKARMKEDMTCMQKKLLLESQKDELNQVKRNLQTIFF